MLGGLGRLLDGIFEVLSAPGVSKLARSSVREKPRKKHSLSVWNSVPLPTVDDIQQTRSRPDYFRGRFFDFDELIRFRGSKCDPRLGATLML